MESIRFPGIGCTEQGRSTFSPAPARLALRADARPAPLKRCVDILGAALLGILLSPLLLLLAFLLKCEGGPVLFRHVRVGRNGRPFRCLKFRTMVPRADQVLRELLAGNALLREEWQRDRKLRVDPRVTRLGRFLRTTSLDELPQLWNVLRGHMSLVGPRPVVRVELRRYGRSSRCYLRVRPGITGLWQVSGRNETAYRRRVAIDVLYVRRHGLLLDLQILLRTALVVVGRRGAY